MLEVSKGKGKAINVLIQLSTKPEDEEGVDV
jgi:hypothetical protein